MPHPVLAIGLARRVYLVGLGFAFEERCVEFTGNLVRPVKHLPFVRFLATALPGPAQHGTTASHILQIILPRRWVDRLDDPAQKETR